MLSFILFMGCGKKIGTGLTNQYQAIEKRYNKGETKISDKLFMQATYRTGILGGNFVVPYASRILRRCINGSDRDLKLHSRYIKKKSPIVEEKLNSLRGKPDGTYRVGGYKQSKDWKLSMAFNPMNITLFTKNETRYATLWYDFDWKKPKKAYDTKIPLGNMSFTLNDGLVHVISDCPTYRVEQTWKLDKSWQ
jgi:hypothetical protein